MSVDGPAGVVIVMDEGRMVPYRRPRVSQGRVVPYPGASVGRGSGSFCASRFLCSVEISVRRFLTDKELPLRDPGPSPVAEKRSGVRRYHRHEYAADRERLTASPAVRMIQRRVISVVRRGAVGFTDKIAHGQLFTV